MNSVSGILKMHFRDKWSWLFIPWSILLFSFFVNLIIGYSVSSDKGIYTGGLSSIFIYIFVLGIITLSQSFPFALGLSVRRKDYFMGTTLFVILLSAVFSILILMFSLTETKLIKGWGVGLHFFNFPFLNNFTIIEQLGIYFVIMMHMFFLGFVISCLYRRFGRNGLYVFFTALFLLSGIGSFMITYNQWWGNIFIWITQQYPLIIICLAPTAVFYAVVSYLLLRRSTL
ncbi:hypothetical protein J6TS2_13160 [Heyndrickxia sporothermodurans]|nr:hypothetical protein J6TS2_13160 [Heyndrickxia sporothermodurans]